MKNQSSLRLLWIPAILAAAFCGYAAYLYQRAGQPPAEQAPPPKNAHPVAIALARPPGMDRYAGLATGRLFFGDIPVKAAVAAPPLPPFVSALTLRGIVLAQGGVPMAILTLTGRPPEDLSWQVKVGDVVQGEKVVAIGTDTVTMKRDGQELVLRLSGQ